MNNAVATLNALNAVFQKHLVATMKEIETYEGAAKMRSLWVDCPSAVDAARCEAKRRAIREMK